MSITLLIAIAIGGAIGAISRFFISYTIAQHLTVLFPWGTIVANVTGCFLIGVITELTNWISLSSTLRTMLLVGILGAFTTFSTFTLETISLARDGEWFMVALNLTLNLFFGFLAWVLGLLLTRGFTRVIV
jgi:CrcB protein